MKKQLALLTILFTVIGTNAFAQGYVEFTTSKDYVYDGGGIVAPGNVTSTFLWALVGTSDPLGSGIPTDGTTYVASGWSTVSSMLSSGWTVAQNANSGNAEVDVADTASGNSEGAIDYNGGSTFQLANTTAGDTYELVVVGWDNLGGATTLEEAMGDTHMGWSNPFDYATGATAGSTLEQFNQSGMEPFGLIPLPEPATLALAGLGGLSMLLIRRRKS
jgi:hypothetical protein